MNSEHFKTFPNLELSDNDETDIENEPEPVYYDFSGDSDFEGDGDGENESTSVKPVKGRTEIPNANAEHGDRHDDTVVPERERLEIRSCPILATLSDDDDEESYHDLTEQDSDLEQNLDSEPEHHLDLEQNLDPEQNPESEDPDPEPVILDEVDGFFWSMDDEEDTVVGTSSDELSEEELVHGTHVEFNGMELRCSEWRMFRPEPLRLAYLPFPLRYDSKPSLVLIDQPLMFSKRWSYNHNFYAALINVKNISNHCVCYMLRNKEGFYSVIHN